ncbi:hypothetical protein [Luteibacter sp. UNCMF366Tsu5.1]|uniref:hypothetical protein n=1 Tax=Luteibacter sp. UNCMF366Tsu5.1 TaxID=1502758 RepID=UPI0009308486|nr:hypothetical protein [Luteibacter sp. UNCMF366Tsu5.1]
MSPVLIMGDHTADIRLRVGAFFLVLLLWSTWAGVNRPFQACTTHFMVLSVVAPPRIARLNAAVPLVITGWPLVPLSFGAAFVGRPERLPWYVAALFLSAASGFIVDALGWRYGQRCAVKIHGGASRRSVLVRHAVVDALPMGKPWLAMRYLLIALCAMCGFRWIDEGDISAPEVLCGTAGIIVWVLRGVADVLRVETHRLVPMLSTTRSLHKLCVARLLVLTILASAIVLIVGMFVSSSFASIAVLLSAVIGGATLLGMLRHLRMDGAADWLAAFSPLIAGMARLAWPS